MFEAFVAAADGAGAVVVVAWAEEDEGDDPERSGFGTDVLLLLLAGPRGNKSSFSTGAAEKLVARQFATCLTTTTKDHGQLWDKAGQDSPSCMTNWAI